MPATIRKKPGTMRYTVKTPGGVKGKSVTLRDAKAQQRLLNAIEHGFDPKEALKRTLRY